MKTAITKENAFYAKAELNFTYDYSGVKVGSVMIDRHGASHTVTRIDKDECDRKQIWEGQSILAVQYRSPHNMLTKSPYYAYEFISEK